MPLIEDLSNLSTKNASVSGMYVVNKCELKPFKNKQGFFCNCVLNDRSGSIKGIVWDNAESFVKKIKNNSVIAVEGEATRYNDTPQLVISKANIVTKYDKSQFVPSLDASYIEELKSYLKEVSRSLIQSEGKRNFRIYA